MSPAIAACRSGLLLESDTRWQSICSTAHTQVRWPLLQAAAEKLPLMKISDYSRERDDRSRMKPSRPEVKDSCVGFMFMNNVCAIVLLALVSRAMDRIC